MPAKITDLRAYLKQQTVVNENGCWIWQRYRNKAGYGIFKSHSAHRQAFIAWNGSIDPDLSACHTCTARACINPAHLYAGTRWENSQDAVAAGTLGMKGERHHKARLTEKLVRQIRAEYASGIPAPRIAERYKIARITAWEVATRRSWTHVKD